MLTSLRLFTRAPCTRIMSWVSATCAGARPSVAMLMRVSICRPPSRRAPPMKPARGDKNSASFLDPDHVPGGVAHRAVTHPVRLLGRLGGDLGAVLAQPLEQAVEVVGGQDDA